MKNLILSVLLLVSVGCSPKSVKKKASTLAGIATAKYVGMELRKDGTCSEERIVAETELLKTDLTSKIDKVLKVDRSADKVIVAAQKDKSLIGDVVRSMCENIISKHLPNIFLDKYESYECSLKVIGQKADKLAAKVCSGIKL